MRAFRITIQKHGATARDVLSGIGGYLADGRWHARGRSLDYAAETQSLAVLERLVHYKRFDALQPHVLCALDIPDAAIVELPSVLPKWDGIDLLPAAQALGNAWCDGKVSPAMRVPSAVTAGEFNLLVNARHPAWRWSWIAAPVPFAFDARLRDLVDSAKRGR